MLNPTTENVTNFYLECVRGSPLPVGLYDRGAHSPYGVPLESLKRICLEPNLIMVKDSSADMARAKIALEAKAARPELRLLTGYEFGCVDYIKAGYDGLLFGGAVFNGHMAGLILSAARKADYVHAQTLQDRMNELMWRGVRRQGLLVLAYRAEAVARRDGTLQDQPEPLQIPVDGLLRPRHQNGGQGIPAGAIPVDGINISESGCRLSVVG